MQRTTPAVTAIQSGDVTFPAALPGSSARPATDGTSPVGKGGAAWASLADAEPRCGPRPRAGGSPGARWPGYITGPP